MERIERLIQEALNTKLTRGQFLKGCLRFLLFMFILSYVPLQLTKGEKKLPFKMKHKRFNFQDLYKKHELAG